MDTAWPERLEVVRGARVVAAGTLEELVALARAGRLRPGDRVGGLAPEPVPLHAVPPLAALVPTPAEARATRVLQALVAFDLLVGAGLALYLGGDLLRAGAGVVEVRIALFLVLLFGALFLLPLPGLVRTRRVLRAQRLAGVPPPPPQQAPRETWLRAMRRRAPVTLGLAVVLVLVQVATWLAPDGWVFARFAKVNDRIWAGEWWRLGTAIFLHQGPIHLAFNGMALLAFGGLVEDLYGGWRFLALYLASGVVASTSSLLFVSGTSVGASGAIFGLMGVLLVFGLRHREVLAPAARRKFTSEIGACIGINVLLGVTAPFIDNAAHLGGLFAGAALGLAVPVAPRVRAALAGRPPPS